jgi:hypothetical protein
VKRLPQGSTKTIGEREKSIVYFVPATWDRAALCLLCAKHDRGRDGFVRSLLHILLLLLLLLLICMLCTTSCRGPLCLA